MGWLCWAALAWLGRSEPGRPGRAGLAVLAGARLATEPNGSPPRTIGGSPRTHLESTWNSPGARTRLGWVGWAGCGRLGWLGWLDGKFYLETIRELSKIIIWAGLAAGWVATLVLIKYRSLF